MSKKKEEKSEIKELKEQLFTKTDKGIASMKESEIKKADKYCEDYKKFIDHSKTEREAVKTAVKLAEKAGFVPFEQDKKYKAGDRIHYLNPHTDLALAAIGKKGVKDGVRLAIAHIDSPRIDLKPNPMYEASGLAMFKTHYYGGIRKYQWGTIPLAIHGVVVKKNGETVDICIGEDETDPVFCVTDLLPHLSAKQNERPLKDGLKGEALNIVIGSLPYQEEDIKEPVKLMALSLLNERYKITEKDFFRAELELVPAVKARDVGLDASMIGAYGQDDRVCAYTALTAEMDAKKPAHHTVTSLTDKEETVSYGNTGLN